MNVLPVNLGFVGQRRLAGAAEWSFSEHGQERRSEQLNGDTGLQTSYGGGRETYLCLSLPLCSSQDLCVCVCVCVCLCLHRSNGHPSEACALSHRRFGRFQRKLFQVETGQLDTGLHIGQPHQPFTVSDGISAW